MSPSLLFSASRRTRQTPYTKKVLQYGASSFTVYNHMLLPTIFESIEADYYHLKKYVQIWDVAVERQVQICGPDATRLVQMLTPRNLQGITLGKCFYAPVVDENGGLLNDPIFMKIAQDKYWLSISDSDLLLWVKGLAYGLKLNVEIEEPNVSPLAIQGPKSIDLAARVFGDAIREVKFFNYSTFVFEGHNLIISRTGWSKQDGFELFLEHTNLAEPLWDALFKAGESLNVRAGCPNLIERIESRLLSYGNDMTRDNNPYECGLEKFCHPTLATSCIGRNALLKIMSQGVKKQIRSFAVLGEPLISCVEAWPIYDNKNMIGHITSIAWSPQFNTNVAIGIVDVQQGVEGYQVEVETPVGFRKAVIKETAFV